VRVQSTQVKNKTWAMLLKETHARVAEMQCARFVISAAADV
jgi:hypothetical protein